MGFYQMQRIKEKERDRELSPGDRTANRFGRGLGVVLAGLAILSILWFFGQFAWLP